MLAEACQIFEESFRLGRSECVNLPEILMGSKFRSEAYRRGATPLGSNHHLNADSYKYLNPSDSYCRVKAQAYPFRTPNSLPIFVKAAIALSRCSWVCAALI